MTIPLSGESIVKLNCDLGESFGAWTMGQDADVMPYIDQANIACGFHASDPVTMHRTLALAAQHKVSVGAHPAYPDLVGFGRRSMVLTAEEVKTLIWYQVGALQGLARIHGITIEYIKPHGALNNDMMADPELLRAVMTAVAAYDDQCPLMIPVSCDHAVHRAMAQEIGIPLLLEAFADRAYDDTGRLVSRRVSGAVLHDPEDIVAQALSFTHKQGIEAQSGKWLDLPADSLCVHGDNAESVLAVAAIRQALGVSE